MATAKTESTPTPPSEVVLISHSMIFYWWPVWAVGFVLAITGYLGGNVLAVVPKGTVAEAQRTVDGHEGPHDVLVAPKGVRLPVDQVTGTLLQPRMRMSASNGPGMIFAVTLCLLIVITNVKLRGLWSVVVILSIALVSIILAALGWWDAILGVLGLIDIHINALGYLSLSLFVFAIWSLTYLLYDRRNKLIFGRGQLRILYAIGLGERVIDTFGMTVEKHRDDVFRHWLLGFGSGDMTVKSSGSNAETFEIPNVLNVSKKLVLLQTMLQERQVVGGRG